MTPVNAKTPPRDDHQITMACGRPLSLATTWLVLGHRPMPTIRPNRRLGQPSASRRWALTQPVSLRTMILAQMVLGLDNAYPGGSPY